MIPSHARDRSCNPRMFGCAGSFARLPPEIVIGTAMALAAATAAQGAAAESRQLARSMPDKNPVAGFAYVGDESCRSCHQAKADSYHGTAHSRTSSLPSWESIHGKFSPGSNILRTANPNLFFVMEATAQGFFEKGVLRTSPAEAMERAERFDVVIGSGRKGQTYLYWDGDQLFQLPVSYWTELGEWINSPGYKDGTADFERPIVPRCLECHASSFRLRPPPENQYFKTSLVLGISCEKCHGPGGEHVVRYRSASPPRSPAAAAIVNPARLSRNRQMDVCALCHGGLGKAQTPPLSFVPGEVLARHLEIPKPDSITRIDVHGSQVQLLARSRCFQSSPTMTCTTCHDVHTPQRDLAASASRCLTCHKIESCRMLPKLGHGIDTQCVACHMPLQQTDQIIISGVNGRVLQPKVRNHQIAIYPDVQLP